MGKTARWGACALALAIAMPAAFADTSKGKKSLAECTSFDQVDKEDDKVQFTINNTCSVPVDCTVTWRVVCAPESKKRRSVHAGSAKLSLGDSTSLSTEASAAVCKDAGWAIDQVHWTCEPNKD